MFEQRRYRTTAGSAIGLIELIYHSTVRDVRKGHGSGGFGLITTIFQTLLLIAVFYAMFSVLGLRASAIRGDFLLYIMSGIFLFMMHIKTIKAVYGAAGPTSPMMQHAPMNTIVAIASVALSTLYLQLLSMMAVLFVYHAAVTPITIHQPLGALAMVLLAWLTGVAIGMMFLVIKPWFPTVASLGQAVFIRLNMFASGKMFVANSMPGFMLPFFTWNPLFHVIDQARGYTFINYNPHYSSIAYPVCVSLALIMLGLMGEYFARRHVSISWDARR